MQIMNEVSGSKEAPIGRGKPFVWFACFVVRVFV